MELKNDIQIRGTLKSVDQYLNIKLDDISVVNEISYPHLVRPSTSLFAWPPWRWFLFWGGGGGPGVSAGASCLSSGMGMGWPGPVRTEN